MLDIRAAQPKDRADVWTIFRDVVSDGTTYAYPSDIEKTEGLRLWIDTPIRPPADPA